MVLVLLVVLLSIDNKGISLLESLLLLLISSLLELLQKFGVSCLLLLDVLRHDSESLHLKSQILQFLQNFALYFRDNLDCVVMVGHGVFDSLKHVANKVLKTANFELRHTVVIFFVKLINLLLNIFYLLLNIRDILREIEGLDLMRKDNDLLLGGWLTQRRLGIDKDSL